MYSPNVEAATQELPGLLGRCQREWVANPEDFEVFVGRALVILEDLQDTLDGLTPGEEDFDTMDEDFEDEEDHTDDGGDFPL
jgi:uncharacterized protein CbrC (UPF0167 family)